MRNDSLSKQTIASWRSVWKGFHGRILNLDEALQRQVPGLTRSKNSWKEKCDQMCLIVIHFSNWVFFESWVLALFSFMLAAIRKKTRRQENMKEKVHQEENEKRRLLVSIRIGFSSSWRMDIIAVPLLPDERNPIHELLQREKRDPLMMTFILQVITDLFLFSLELLDSDALDSSYKRVRELVCPLSVSYNTWSWAHDGYGHTFSYSFPPLTISIFL